MRRAETPECAGRTSGIWQKGAVHLRVAQGQTLLQNEATWNFVQNAELRAFREGKLWNGDERRRGRHWNRPPRIGALGGRTVVIAAESALVFILFPSWFLCARIPDRAEFTYQWPVRVTSTFDLAGMKRLSLDSEIQRFTTKAASEPLFCCKYNLQSRTVNYK